MLKKLAWVFAAVFVVAGVLGFIPAAAPDGYLLGLFEVDALHNIIHIVSGLVFAYGAMASEKTAQMVFKVFGVVYAIVAVVGLVQGDTVLGLIRTNTADHVLHIILAVAILYIGFGMKGEYKMANAPASSPSSGTPAV